MNTKVNSLINTINIIIMLAIFKAKLFSISILRFDKKCKKIQIKTKKFKKFEKFEKNKK